MERNDHCHIKSIEHIFCPSFSNKIGRSVLSPRYLIHPELLPFYSAFSPNFLFFFSNLPGILFWDQYQVLLVLYLFVYRDDQRLGLGI